MPTHVERPFIIRGEVPPWTLRRLFGRLRRVGVPLHCAEHSSARAGSNQIHIEAKVLELETQIVRFPYAMLLNQNVKPGEHSQPSFINLGTFSEDTFVYLTYMLGELDGCGSTWKFGRKSLVGQPGHAFWGIPHRLLGARRKCTPGHQSGNDLSWGV